MTCTLSVACWRSKRKPSLLRAACLGFLCLGLGVASWAAPSPQKDKDLRIYFVDVEGGQATLVRHARGAVPADRHGLAG